ncbi:extracellular catalytic domain type 1 short-chain-length polyhydroxyalkanoate depolymerase [Frankia tisae]|uniref:extracellular catalytic domain type 1 short-chain-length polyhydroxyalkanoate depolymerase n=1 Tax=Frankia tisae TaxID=2950104 RepID=UPI003F684EF6
MGEAKGGTGPAGPGSAPPSASPPSTSPATVGSIGGPALHAGTTGRTLTTPDGRQRTYLVHVPSVAAPATSAMPATRGALPVVLVLHGGGGSARQAEQQTGMSAVADREGFLAVYPDGTGRRQTALLTWNAGTCCGYAHDNGVDDVGFVAALLDQLSRDYPVDPARIYATGMSNGAMMSYRLGCELAGRIAAIAPVSGAMNTTACAPSRPLPVIAFHGTADDKVRYDGGESSIGLRQGDERADRSVAEAMAFWTGRDGCPATPARSRQGAVVHGVYGPCALGGAVELYSITGAGHAWPGGARPREQADPPPPAPDASAVMWDFFTHHTLAA